MEPYRFLLGGLREEAELGSDVEGTFSKAAAGLFSSQSFFGDTTVRGEATSTKSTKEK